MARMRIIIEVDTDQPRRDFNRMVFTVATNAFPGCVYIATEKADEMQIVSHDGMQKTAAAL